MWYSYKINDAGQVVCGKTFESKKDFIKYACKSPKETLYVSNTEPDTLGRAYSENPHFNK